MSTAILKSNVGAISIRTHDPNGKEYVFHWNEKNSFTLEVPTEMTYQDPFDPNKQKVFNKNFAQHLLDSQKDLNSKSPTFGEHIFELVEIVEKPEVKAPAVVDKRKKKEKIQ